MGSILDFSYDPFPFRGGWIGGLALVVLAAILWAFRRRSGLDRADPRRIGAFGLFAAGGLLVAAHIPLLWSAAVQAARNSVSPAETGPEPVSEQQVIFHGLKPGQSSLVAQVWAPVVSPAASPAASAQATDCVGLSIEHLRDHARPVPVILYVPRSGGTRLDNRSMAMTLASYGYLVVAIDDVEVRPAAAGAPAAPPLVFDFSSRKAILHTFDLADRKALREAADALSVLDRLQACLPDDVKGRVDTRRVGFWGFSIGGAAAANAALLDRRIAAVVNEDGTVYGRPAQGASPAPYLLLIEDAPVERRNPTAVDAAHEYDVRLSRSEQKLWRALVQRPDHYAFILHGVVHESFSDLIFDRAFLRNWLVIPPQQPRSERKAYLLDFFGKYLRGQPAPLLDRSDSPFGNVQPLRGNAAWTAAVDSVRVTEADRRLISPDKPIP